MKKIILAYFMVIFVFSGLAYAQSKAVQTENPEVKAKVEKILDFAEKKQNSPSELNQGLHDLNFYIRRCRSNNIGIPVEVKQDVTQRLVAIFDRIDDSGINHANKLRIIELTAHFDNSPMAHEFILKMMESKNKEHQEMALWAMGPAGVHGDDVYDKIKNLMAVGVLKEEKFLYALKSANRDRALKEIQDFLAKTKSQNQFIRKGLLLCEYNDPKLLDILIDRYDEFKNMGPQSEEERSTYASAETAFDPKVLRQYMGIREGKRFRTALEILGAKGISGNKDLPLFEKKLKSKNIETREAVLDFLGYRLGDHSVSREKLKALLRSAGDTESDMKLKFRIHQMEKKIIGD